MGDNAEKKRVITISREYGSGGRLIGKRLAEKLGVPYYDRDTINERISRESGYDKDMFAGQEKKAKNSFLYSLASAMGTGEAGPESLSRSRPGILKSQRETVPGTVRYHPQDRGGRLLRNRWKMRGLYIKRPSVCDEHLHLCGGSG